MDDQAIAAGLAEMEETIRQALNARKRSANGHAQGNHVHAEYHAVL